MSEHRHTVGVIGCGNMGRNHIRVLSTMPEYELVGCYDTRPEAARTQAELYGTRAFESIDELLSSIEVAHIVVPSFLHCDIATKAAEHGCHVLVEKPIALTEADAQTIIDACNRANTRLCVGHVERFNPAIRALAQILESEQIISVSFRRMSPFDPRVSDASVVQDLMIHDIDVLNSIANSPIKEVVAHGARVYTDSIDYCQALVTYEDGMCASLTASRVTEGKVRVAEVICKDAFITVDYIGKSVEISRRTNFTLDVGHKFEYRQENIVERVVVPLVEPLRAEFEHFAHCIDTGEDVLTSGPMGKAALALCTRIEQATGLTNS